MPDTTARYKLPYIMPSQAQKHVTVNESLRRLDAFTHLALAEIGRDTPPDSPMEGAAYSIGMDPVGLWSGHAGQITAFIDGAWEFVPPFRGLTAIVGDPPLAHVFDGEAWTPLAGGAGGSVDKLGVNTGTDEINRCAVKSDGILFSTDDGASDPSGDVRVVLNKTAADDVASLLFQTGYSGRAELSLAQGDDFHLRVSADGETFHSALQVDSATGNLGLGGRSYVPLAVMRALPGAITQMQVTNLEADAGSGAAINVIAGSHFTQFLQYAAGSSYLVSTSSSFYLQATGPGASVNVYAGSQAVFGASETGMELSVPLRLKTATVSTLPSPSTAGNGALIFITDASGGAVPAFCDGTHWRRMTDRAVVA